jgi:hypothetical protein
MLGTSAHVVYIPFSQIDYENRAFSFRAPAPVKVNAIKQEMMKLGQLNPITVEEVSMDHYFVLDGFRRCEAVAEILRAGGQWEKMMAQVIESQDLTPLTRFQLLRSKNLGDGQGYRSHERSLFYNAFHGMGLTVSEMAREGGITAHEIEDHLELAQAPPDLANLLNESEVPVIYAVMLVRRYQGWIKGPYAAFANAITLKILEEARPKKITMKSWRFVLDFYGGENKPFLAKSRGHP